MSKRPRIAAVVFALFLVAPSAFATDAVTAKVETVNIPTFSLGPGDPAPAIFGNRETYAAYPRTTIDIGTRAKDPVDKEYKLDVLENSLLRVEVNPAVGGRVWRIIDKKTGTNLLWTNDAIKPVRVGRLEGWLAGGIEFPFPVSNHGEDTMDPYRSAMRENSDGSATVTVSSFDHFYRFWSSYDITVSPDDARVALTCRLYNPTDVRNRYQLWVNGAVKASDDLQFIFPVDYIVGHGFDGTFTWPSWDGSKDRSWWKNQADQLGVFSFDADFHGAYYHNSDIGIIRYSSRKNTRGIKLWTWGTNSSWTREYSLNQGSYCEVQGGVYPTQTMYGWLEPHEMNEWTEYWYPVRGIGGVDYASPYAAMKVDIDSTDSGPISATVGINLLKPITGQLTVASAGNTLLSKDITAAAGDVVKETVDVSMLSTDSVLNISLCDASKLCVISADAPITKKRAPEPTVPSSIVVDSTGPESDALIAALTTEINDGDLASARDAYTRITKQYPSFVPGWKCLGILAYKQTDYAASLDALSKAVDLAPTDPEARYYLGLTQLALGNTAAIDTLKSVKGDTRFVHAARVVLGRELLKSGQCGGVMIAGPEAMEGEEKGEGEKKEEADEDEPNPDEHPGALTTLSHAAAGWSRDPLNWDYLALAARLGHNDKVAAEARASALAADPLDPFVSIESLFAESTATPESISAALGADPDLYLEIALYYSNVNVPNEALAVAQAGEPLADSALYHYYLAYFADKAGNKSAAIDYAKKAAEKGTAYVFPHRAEDITILNSVATLSGDEGYPKFHEATLLYWLGRTDDASATWQNLVGRYNIPGLYRNIARSYSEGRLGRDVATTIDVYVKAIEQDPEDVQLYATLDDLYDLSQEREKRGALLESASKLFPEDDQIALRMVIYLNTDRKSAKAAEILETHTFHRTHQSFMLSHLGRQAITDTYTALAMDALRHDDTEKALDYLQKASSARETLRKWFD